MENQRKSRHLLQKHPTLPCGLCSISPFWRTKGNTFCGMRLPAASDAVHDEGQRTVARHIAGCAETVHGYVEGYHQCLVVFREAEHRRKYAEGGHDGPARHARSRHHRDAEHTDEAGHLLETVVHPLHGHQGEGAGHYLQRTAG